MRDADSDRQAHAEIAQANAAMPNKMSDREFREETFALLASADSMPGIFRRICWLRDEWRKRNG